jgi:Na+-translocating ferredoxin:NAD+ oxidoreductase RNF subunit RnfB
MTMSHDQHGTSYDHLQQRLDRNAIGAPAHRALFDLLRELYTPEESSLAAAMPFRPASARRIAHRAGLSQRRAEELLGVMQRKGLVVDLPRPDGRVSWFLNPTVVGFFEFTMMRVRDDVDQRKVATLLWEYMRRDPDQAFLRMLGEGPTFIARPLVHEDALEAGTYSEVLDWERASAVVEAAGSWAEGICHCRHVRAQLGHRCGYPLEHCLSLGTGADYLVRAGLAKKVDKERALDVLVHAREHDCVQMVDNVKRRPTFVCNCCSCCCEMLECFRVLGDRRQSVTSNHVATIADAACNGCGACVKKCPIGALELVPAPPLVGGKKRKAAARVNAALCLGCGVCRRHCKLGALELRRIPVRVHTPDTQMERILLQALERGKLQHILFDDPSRLSHRVLGTVFGTLLDLPPAKQLLARQQLRSRFVDLLLGGMKRAGAGGRTAKVE